MDINTHTNNKNLIFIDDLSYKQDVLQVTYLINKEDTYISAIKMYFDLLLENSLLYKTRTKLNQKLNSLYGAKLSIDYKILDSKYQITCTIKTPCNKFIKKFKNVQLEAVRFLYNLLNQGLFKDPKVFEKVLQRNISSISSLLKDPYFDLKNKIHLNFLPNLTYGILPFGTKEEYEVLKQVDIDHVQECLQNCDRVVTYLGDCQANAINLVNTLFHPTPIISNLKLGDFFLKENTSLEAFSPLNLSLASLLVTIPSEDTLKINVINNLIVDYIDIYLKEQLKKNLTYSSDFTLEKLYKGNVLNITVKLRNKNDYQSIKYYRDIILNSKDFINEKIVDKLKLNLKHKYMLLVSDVDKLVNFISENNILNLSYDIDKIIEAIDSIGINDIVKKLGTMQIIGDISIYGNKGE